MGYTTDFYGSITLEPSLTSEQAEYINRFSGTRRMKRDPEKLAKMLEDKGDDKFPEWLSPHVPGMFGIDGEFYVGGDDGSYRGQEKDESVIDSNSPPRTQPGLWCQWIAENEGSTLEWDGGEKFYDYVEWMTYICEQFLAPWGIDANGQIDWQGEERDDLGQIHVTHTRVSTKNAVISWR